MSTLELFEISEKLVDSSLRSLGYYRIEKYDKYLIADGGRRQILVYISMNNSENNLQKNDHTTLKRLKKDASKLNREAWAALIQINESGEPTNEVSWQDMSR